MLGPQVHIVDGFDNEVTLIRYEHNGVVIEITPRSSCPPTIILTTSEEVQKFIDMLSLFT